MHRFVLLSMAMYGHARLFNILPLISALQLQPHILHVRAHHFLFVRVRNILAELSLAIPFVFFVR